MDTLTSTDSLIEITTNWFDIVEVLDIENDDRYQFGGECADDIIDALQNNVESWEVQEMIATFVEEGYDI
jgi:hypothetical protein